MLGSLLQKVGQNFFDLLLPPTCVHCQVAGSHLCANCLDQIPFITGTVCLRCGLPLLAEHPCKQCRAHPLRDIDGIRSAAPFIDGPLRSAIHAFKYKNYKALTPVLGEILAEAYRRYELKIDVIVPVPLYPANLKERGYNQCELLAGQLSQATGLPLNLAALRRIRKTESQMTLGLEERSKNVSSAFGCGEAQLVQQQVLLIDDVCTTGSTLDACAVALKAGGAASVWGLTLAKTQ